MAQLDLVDQQLLQAVSGATPATIPDVIQIMQAIDALLPGSDGLKWFNLLYLNVTENIDGQPPATAWSDPAWLTRLDVVFAGLYFNAIAGYLQDSDTVASSWSALFEARTRPDIDRIQFALAGMNAHINHDLALALVQTDEEMNLHPGLDSPEYADYQRVNSILTATLPAALQFLAIGVLGELAEDTGRIGQLLAMWDVAAARDVAWEFADHLRTLDGPVRQIALDIQDKMTGLAGRGLLLPLR